MLAKQPQDYYRGRLDEDNNESLVVHENLTRHTSNTHLAYTTNNDDHENFLREDNEGIWIEHRGNEK